MEKEKSAEQAAEELRGEDWMEDYGGSFAVAVDDEEEMTLDVTYKDSWGREWFIPMRYSGDEDFMIAIPDVSEVPLTPENFWSYLFIEAASQVDELRKERY